MRNTSVSPEKCILFSGELPDVLARNASWSREKRKLPSQGLPDRHGKHLSCLRTLRTFPNRRAATSNPEPNYAVKAHNLGPAEQFAADIFAECGKIASKLKFDLGVCPFVAYHFKARSRGSTWFHKVVLTLHMCEMIEEECISRNKVIYTLKNAA